MEAPSNYNVEVESILGGLESALARGQPLKKAMSSFRNAGYKEKNIEEAARKFQILHRRRFHELGVDPNKQKKIIGSVSQYGNEKQKTDEEKQKEQRPKTLVTSKTREQLINQYEHEKSEMEARKPQKRIQGAIAGGQQIDQDLKSSEAELEKTAGEAPAPTREGSGKSRKSKRGREKEKEKRISGGSEGSGRGKKTQVVSGYGDEALQASENFRAAIDEMVKSMGKLSVPQQIAPQSRRERKQKPQVINKISNYGMKPPTPVNKAVTFLLIFLLILLLGVLAAVFFFREELIDLFNTFSLEYILPLVLGKS
jgi:hypothetical protein